VLPEPYIYVLARTQRADGLGHLFNDYLYLGYDGDRLQGTESKLTRWEAPTFPSACYYGFPVESTGDSVPAGLAVHHFDGNWYLMRNGRSYTGPASGDDLVTSVEIDHAP
jgi:hypothetical protein